MLSRFDLPRCVRKKVDQPLADLSPAELASYAGTKASVTLRREIDRLRGERDKLGATVPRLQSEVDLRRIVAPIDGTIGEATNLRPGVVVAAGQQLGAIVPDGRLKIVAQFEPATAFGRIRRGQPARVRLQGFPRTQYGTLPV